MRCERNRLTVCDVVQSSGGHAYIPPACGSGAMPEGNWRDREPANLTDTVEPEKRAHVVQRQERNDVIGRPMTHRRVPPPVPERDGTTETTLT